MYNSFDKIIVTININDVNYLNEDLFSKSINKEGVVTFENYKDIGLGVSVNKINNNINIELSSKILKSDYPKKISLLNIVNILKKIKHIIDIEPYKFMRSKPILCEITSDIYVENTSQTIKVLHSLAKVKTGYKTLPRVRKHGRKETSFYIKKDVATKYISEYVSIYNKYNEFFESYKNENNDLLDILTEKQIEKLKLHFENIVRIETSYNSRQAIKYAFKFNSSFDLFDLMFSRININKIIFQKIYDDKSIKGLSSGVTYKQFDKYNTLYQYDFDLDRIYNEYRLRGGTGQKSKVLKPYKKILATIKASDKHVKIIENIKNKLQWKKV